MSKIEQNKQRKRQDILRAAQAVFLSEGYVVASMDKIAAEAKMTKQTVYRYFPSKIELFHATLAKMGEGVDDSFLQQLSRPDIREALRGFAREFIVFHLSEEHIATFRLLSAESGKAPEIAASFMSVGPDSTEQALAAFFAERLGIENSADSIELWTGMLLALRNRMMMGQPRPSDAEITEYANKATDFLLAAYGKLA